MLKVSKQPDGRPEIFYSIQGEGVNTGRPAVFLRLALCNLNCVWCDTRYTWDDKQYNLQEQILQISLEEAGREIINYPCRYLVVTGGEPMLQQTQLLSLLEPLKNRGFYIDIETNGTIIPLPDISNLVNHWSVSPKTANSENPLSTREVPESYRFLSALPSSHFKYVIQNEDDFTEVQGLVKKYRLAPHQVILMPEAQDRDILLERSRWLVELCKTRGYLFSTRLQVLLWGNRRCV